MSDTDDDNKGTETPPPAQGVQNPPSQAASATETNEHREHDGPTREEFQTLTGMVQTLVDTVAQLVPQSRDTSPVKTPWYARGSK